MNKAGKPSVQENERCVFLQQGEAPQPRVLFIPAALHPLVDVRRLADRGSRVLFSIAFPGSRTRAPWGGDVAYSRTWGDDGVYSRILGGGSRLTASQSVPSNR